MSYQQTILCPSCSETLSELHQYVTEQRKYQFVIANNEYAGPSDPVDDTSILDSVICPKCFARIPESLVAAIAKSYDAFAISP